MLYGPYFCLNNTYGLVDDKHTGRKKMMKYTDTGRRDKDGPGTKLVLPEDPENPGDESKSNGLLIEDFYMRVFSE